MRFKVIQRNTDPNNHNMVLKRGIIVPRNLGPMGYNYALAPKSNAYFTEVQLECDPP